MGLRTRNIEFTIIKISIILACLIITAGLGLKVWEGKQVPFVAPVSSQPSVPVGGSEDPLAEDPLAEAPNLSKQPPGKVVAIGDSYTFGYPYGLEFSWVKLAATALGSEFINQGRTSQSSTDLLNRFQSDVLDLSPESVIVTIGTGDAMRGITLEKYQANIQEMVGLARSRNIDFVIGLPLPYPDDNIKKLVSAYREWLIGYAQANDLSLIDFNTGLIDDSGNILQEFSEDGKYPNKQGYELMAQTVEKIFH